MIDSLAIHAEAFRINENNHWELEEYRRIDDALAIPTIEVTMPLTDIYDGVAFDDQE